MFVRKKPRLDGAKQPVLPAIKTDSSPETALRPAPIGARDRPVAARPRLEKVDPPPAPKVPVPAKRPELITAAPSSSKAGKDQVSGRLIIGQDIELKGEITECDELVVDGNLDASVTARHLKISSGGTVVGRFEVQSADIDGRFSGDLIVMENLSVRAGGRVEGRVRYGSMEVALGGIVKGDVDETGDSAELPEHGVATVRLPAFETAR